MSEARKRTRTTKRGEALIRRAVGLLEQAAGQISENATTRWAMDRAQRATNELLTSVSTEREQ